MEQQHPVHALSGTLGQLFVGAVERVAGLEGDHVGSAELRQAGAGLGRREAQLLKVVVPRELEHAQPAGQVEPAPAMHLGHQRVAGVGGGEDLARDRVAVPGVDLFEGQHGQQLVLGVAQGHVGIELERVARLDWQGDGDGEDVAAGQAHLGADARKVGLAHEAVQGREGAGGQQFQVAHDPLRNLQRRQAAGLRLEGLGGLARDHQVHQRAAIRADKLIGL
jgi:hypothetical protein